MPKVNRYSNKIPQIFHQHQLMYCYSNQIERSFSADWIWCHVGILIRFQWCNDILHQLIEQFILKFPQYFIVHCDYIQQHISFLSPSLKEENRTSFNNSRDKESALLIRSLMLPPKTNIKNNFRYKQPRQPVHLYSSQRFLYSKLAVCLKVSSCFLSSFCSCTFPCFRTSCFFSISEPLSIM